jgi:outer membrane assembly lipoprotein YfiO
MIKTRKRMILAALLLLVSSYSINSAASKNKQQFDIAIAQESSAIESTQHKKRMRKPSSSDQTTEEKNTPKIKRKRNRTYMDFEYEELVKAKDVQRTKGNVHVTIKYLEQLLKLCTDITLLSEHLLELADVLYEDGQHSKASLVYTQYCSLYPGSVKQEYALYRSIISSFACILPIDRDQTKTEETVGLTEVFLKQDHFKQYRDEVAHIQTKCYEHLAASECDICNFYIARNKFPAAEKRLKKIRSYWLPKLATLEPTIIAMEANLTEQKEKILAVHTRPTQLAQNSKTKHMANRF